MATTYLMLLIALLDQRVQPAARFQIEDDLHGGHQAGAGRRHRARPHPRLHDRGHGAAGDHGAVQRRLRLADARPYARGRSRQAGKRLRRERQAGRQERPHDAPASQHRHEVEIYPDGTGRALSTNEHEHAITSRQVGGETVYAAERPAGHVPGPRAAIRQAAVSRPPGRRSGHAASASAANGRTAASSKAVHAAAAIWTFSGINESVLRSDAEGQVLPLELIVRVFRTYKGNIETGIQGSMQLRNPDSKLDERPVDLHGQGRVDQHVRPGRESSTMWTRTRST